MYLQVSLRAHAVARQDEAKRSLTSIYRTTNIRANVGRQHQTLGQHQVHNSS